MINWPGALIEDLARRRAVVVLGAGASRRSQGLGGQRPPTWGEFLQGALAECRGSKTEIQRLIRRYDYLTACELIKHRMDEDWPRYLRNKFVEPRFPANDLHREIYRLDCRNVLTPNFDKIYDGLCTAESDGTITIKTYYDDDLANICRGSGRYVLKIHGSIDLMQRMIFTRNEYAKARIEHARFYRIFEALVLTNTFLFVGCGLYDPDIQFVLENIAFTYPGSPPHYIATTKSTNEMHEYIRRNLNMKVLSYSPKDDHEELVRSLRILADDVEEYRSDIGQRQDW